MAYRPGPDVRMGFVNKEGLRNWLGVVKSLRYVTSSGTPYRRCSARDNKGQCTGYEMVNPTTRTLQMLIGDTWYSVGNV